MHVKSFGGQKEGSSEPPRTPPAYGPGRGVSIFTAGCPHSVYDNGHPHAYIHVNIGIGIIRQDTVNRHPGCIYLAQFWGSLHSRGTGYIRRSQAYLPGILFPGASTSSSLISVTPSPRSVARSFTRLSVSFNLSFTQLVNVFVCTSIQPAIVRAKEATTERYVSPTKSRTLHFPIS